MDTLCRKGYSNSTVTLGEPVHGYPRFPGPDLVQRPRALRFSDVRFGYSQEDYEGEYLPTVAVIFDQGTRR